MGSEASAPRRRSRRWEDSVTASPMRLRQRVRLRPSIRDRRDCHGKPKARGLPGFEYALDGESTAYGCTYSASRATMLASMVTVACRSHSPVL